MADNNPLKGYYLVMTNENLKFIIFAESKQDAVDIAMKDINYLEHWALFYHLKTMIVSIEKYRNKKITEEEFFSIFKKDEKAYQKIYQKIYDITLPLEILTIWSK
jgi:hypothetical protein